MSTRKQTRAFVPPLPPDRACLYAAAPDLLEACKSYLEWRNAPIQEGGGPAKMEWVLRQMRAAIAKAEGRS